MIKQKNHNSISFGVIDFFYCGSRWLFCAAYTIHWWKRLYS